jgi:hypothetical protein
MPEPTPTPETDPAAAPAHAAPEAEAEPVPGENGVPPLPPGARIIRRGAPAGAVASPEQVREALRNQSRIRTVREVTLTAVAELRGDGEEGGQFREAVTLWYDGKKVADVDSTQLDSLFPA